MRALTSFLALLALAAPAAALEVPARPEHGVADPGGVLAPSERKQIEDQLEGYARDTTARYAVAIFPSLESEVMQDFGIKMFDAWKLGDATKKDGVLIAIYEKEHKIRFDVGYGLEDKLPDITCKHIIDEQMAPRFRKGDRVGGILAGLAFVDQQATGRASAAPYARSARDGGRGSGGASIVLFLIIMVVLIALRTRGGRRGGFPFIWWGGGGGGFGGGGGGGGGWGGGGGGSAGGGGADGGW